MFGSEKGLHSKSYTICFSPKCKDVDNNGFLNYEERS